MTDQEIFVEKGGKEEYSGKKITAWHTSQHNG